MSGILKGLLAEKTIVGPGPFFGHFQKLSGPAQKIQNLTIFWAKNGIWVFCLGIKVGIFGGEDAGKRLNIGHFGHFGVKCWWAECRAFFAKFWAFLEQIIWSPCMQCAQSYFSARMLVWRADRGRSNYYETTGTSYLSAEEFDMGRQVEILYQQSHFCAARKTWGSFHSNISHLRKIILPHQQSHVVRK